MLTIAKVQWLIIFSLFSFVLLNFIGVSIVIYSLVFLEWPGVLNEKTHEIHKNKTHQC